MKVRRHLVSLFILVLVVSALTALPAVAQEETTEPETTSEMVEPAVTVPETADEDTLADWTYRYMIPSGIALGVVVIVVTSAQYFVRVVRKRYRTIGE